jgi:hypothetical protein
MLFVLQGREEPVRIGLHAAFSLIQNAFNLLHSVLQLASHRVFRVKVLSLVYQLIAVFLSIVFHDWFLLLIHGQILPEITNGI